MRIRKLWKNRRACTFLAWIGGANCKSDGCLSSGRQWLSSFRCCLASRCTSTIASNPRSGLPVLKQVRSASMSPSLRWTGRTRDARRCELTLGGIRVLQTVASSALHNYVRGHVNMMLPHIFNRRLRASLWPLVTVHASVALIVPLCHPHNNALLNNGSLCLSRIRHLSGWFSLAAVLVDLWGRLSCGSPLVVAGCMRQRARAYIYSFPI
mmetsp:Transcript_53666/g.173302  ORF Transcript_53666/g.173302 Transcript_53666/m.173302 type:complete len:210 (+) Transcript_53666:721-1350(+)